MLATEFSGNDFTIKQAPRRVGDPHRTTSLLLGAIRLRQLRVQKNQGCVVSSLFAHIFADCKALYREAFQSTADFSSKNAPTYTRPNYFFRESTETGGTSLDGKFAT